MPRDSRNRPKFDTRPDWPSIVLPQPFTLPNPCTIPPRDFLYGRHYVRGFLSVTVAAGASGKTSELLVEATSMSIGRDLLNSGQELRKPLRVWVHTGEEPRDEFNRRIAAIAERYGLSDSDFGGRMKVTTMETPMPVARLEGRDAVINTEQIDSMIAAIRAEQIDVLIAEPLVTLHSVPENDSGAVDQVARVFTRIAVEGHCAVEIAHHLRKLGPGEATIEDARGAVALIAAARTARLLVPMSAKEAPQAGIRPEDARRYFSIVTGKANLVPASELRTWRHFDSVSLDNAIEDRPADNVAVVTAWSWPDAFAGVTADHLAQVQEAIGKAEPRHCRADPQSTEWVGLIVAPIVGLTLATEKDKAAVKKMIKTWVGNGSLFEQPIDHPTRRGTTTKVIRPGRPA